MREMDLQGLKLCAFQGRVFELSLKECASSSPIFVRRFMNSKEAEALDRGGFLFSGNSEISVLRGLESEYGPSSYGKQKYSSEALYWMGYLYRYWCYTRERTSAQVYRVIAARELVSLYLPYHSLDPGSAISRIYEAKGLPEHVDYYTRALELFRERLIARERSELNRE